MPIPVLNISTMRYLFFLLILVAKFSAAQVPSYKGLSKEDLIELLKQSNKENIFLKTVIKNNNDVFLTDIFLEKYTPKYFTDTDLEKEDKSEKINNANVLIRSVLAGSDPKTEDLAKRALAFNNRYILLYIIRKTVLYEKFDSLKVAAALDTLQSLPPAEAGSKILATQTEIINLLKNYYENSCLLKVQLNKLKVLPDQKALAPSYIKLQQDPRYKKYVYLQTVISDMKASVNNYTQDKLPPCGR